MVGRVYVIEPQMTAGGWNIGYQLLTHLIIMIMLVKAGLGLIYFFPNSQDNKILSLTS